MRPSQLHRVAIPAFFVSCKCEIAVPTHRQPLLRHALEQAALDPLVRVIRYRTGPVIECPPVSLCGAVLDRADGRFLLRVYETRPERRVDEVARVAHALARHGLRLLERDGPDVRREPLFSNARTVWSYVRHDVSLHDRLRISVALEEGGPQSLLELEERARPSCDVFGAVCALACQDLVRLNIDAAPLGPRTIVLGR